MTSADLMRHAWVVASVLAANSFAQQPDTAAQWAILRKATEACRELYGDSKLAPLLGKVPIPDDAAVTDAMLQLNRKPNAAELNALRVYSATKVQCRRLSADAFAQMGPEGQDSASQIANAKPDDDTRILSDGKLTFAEYNAHLKDWREMADAAMKNYMNEVQTQAREAAHKQRQDIEAWHGQALATCGADGVCANIANQYRDHAIACIGGDQQACDSKAQDQAAIDRWNESKRNQASLAQTILLTCTVPMRDGSQLEPVFQVDLKNSKVNGNDATITDAQFAWNNSGFQWMVNRFSGGLQIADQHGFLRSGQCRTASQKQF